jgi:hemerythrin-like domain-containing protein
MTTIGERPTPGFEDPLGVMRDCHRRSERFLAVLAAVTADAQGARLGTVQHEAVGTALRYFRQAAPLHTADEELSLFPRLRAAGALAGVLGATTARLGGLHVEHAYEVAQHATVQSLMHTWLTFGGLGARATADLCRALDALATLYRRHVAYEDNELYPLARTVLTPSAIATIGAEMAARRGLGEGRTTYLRLHVGATAHRDQRAPRPGKAT